MITSIIIIIIITGLMLTPINAYDEQDNVISMNTNANNASIPVNNGNAANQHDNGIIWDNAFPENKINPKYIVDSDDRMKITNTMKPPYDNIVNIISYDGRDDDSYNTESALEAHHVNHHAESCTGVLLSSTVVLTAGHCLYYRYYDSGKNLIGKGNRGDFIVIPARNGGDMNKWNNPDYNENPSSYPRGVYETNEMWYDRRFINGNDGYYDHTKFNYDWGILFLKTPVKDYNDEFTYGKYVNSDLPSLSVASYPKNTPEHPDAKYFDYSMWLSTGKYLGNYSSFKWDTDAENYSNLIAVDNDVTPGSSGAGVYNKNHKIIGIISFQDRANNGYPLNIVRIIDDELEELLMKATSKTH